jgi:fimbrial chaperone protein
MIYLYSLLMGLLSLVPTAYAATFSIDPVRLELSQAVKTAIVRVENTSTTATTVQVQAMAWSQVDKQDVLRPSRDLIVSPAVFRLKPGSVQIVRVALLKTPDTQRELSYRLVLDEIPPPPPPDFRGLQMALKISMPVFIQAEEGGAADLDIAVTPVVNNQLKLVLSNRGQTHAKIKSLQVLGEVSQLTIAHHDTQLYILPGQQRELLLTVAKLPAPLPDKLTIRAVTMTGPIDFHGIPVSH